MPHYFSPNSFKIILVFHPLQHLFSKKVLLIEKSPWKWYSSNAFLFRNVFPASSDHSLKVPPIKAGLSWDFLKKKELKRRCSLSIPTFMSLVSVYTSCTLVTLMKSFALLCGLPPLIWPRGHIWGVIKRGVYASHTHTKSKQCILAFIYSSIHPFFLMVKRAGGIWNQKFNKHLLAEISSATPKKNLSFFYC